MLLLPTSLMSSNYYICEYYIIAVFFGVIALGPSASLQAVIGTVGVCVSVELAGDDVKG